MGRGYAKVLRFPVRDFIRSLFGTFDVDVKCGLDAL